MTDTHSIDRPAAPDTEAWPRDFDIREQYAEQQELLKPYGDDAPAENHPKGTTHAQ